MYEQAAAQIRAAIGPRIVAIEHVGSTAVPGLEAKPIIDIMVGVRQLVRATEHCIAPLARIGYEYVPKPYPDRRFFRRGPWGNGTHHLHLVEWGGEDWRRALRFRDYLRQHPDAARQYADLKRQLAAAHGRDRRAYAADKTAFIEDVLARAVGEGPVER